LQGQNNTLHQNTDIRMTIIFFLIIVSLIVALGFLGAFVWAVRSGQYDDDYTPSIRILFDDEKKAENNKQQTIDNNGINRKI
jgi:cbb3-type cytochrome oxidase maturation protein